MRLISPSAALCFSGLVVASGCSLIASPDESLLDGSGGDPATTSSGSGLPSSSSAASTTTTSSSSPQSSSSGGAEGGGGGATTSQGGGGSNQGGGGSNQGGGGSNQGGGGSEQGGGGAGGGGCVDPEIDCPPTGNECINAICDGELCSTENVGQGTETSLGQIPGDCEVQVCDGDGGTEIIDDDGDAPADIADDCIASVTCSNGDPVEVFEDEDTPCGAGLALLCNDSGVCVGCNGPGDCGTPATCQVNTCIAEECGTADEADDTVIPDPDENCTEVTCQGGAPVPGPDDGDIEDDDNDCTIDDCDAGDPTHNPQNSGFVCDLGGVPPIDDGFCDGTADADACVECVSDDNCGNNNLCETNNCNGGNTCDATVFVGTGIEVDDPTPGDCQHTECDGSGTVLLGQPDSNPPTDTPNDCTTPNCVGGTNVPNNLPAGTACTVPSGLECNNNGVCVAFFCTSDADCNANDTFCSDSACNTGTGACFGTPRNNGSVDTDVVDNPNDCQDAICSGGTSSPQASDTEIPVDDLNACTQEICSGGVPHPPVAEHSACIGGGGFCDSPPTCVECTQDGPQCVSGDCDEGTNTCNVGAAPTVTSTVPGAGDTDEDPLGTISVTFSAAMNPATITGKTDATTTACTGSVQLSEDDFATCVAIDLSMTAGNTVAQLDPAPAMSYGRPYKIRVTTGAQSALGAPLASTFTLATAFTTEVDDVSEVGGGRRIVISQVYTGSGDASPTFDRDFVELHNRGTTAFSVAGMSLQVAAAGSSTWSVQPLSGSIPAGGYLLVALAAGGMGGAALPTPDIDGSIAMDTAAGKVALKVNLPAFTMQCPTGNGIVNLVGYGTAPGCVEGSAAPAPSSTTALVRGGAGCADNDQNATDFTAALPAPRNASTSAFSCIVRVLNESGITREIDACTIENAITVTGSAGSTVSVSALVDEAGLTNAAGAGFGLSVQIGVGPRDTNPETEAGWVYTATAFLSQSGTADQWGLAAFTLPAAGTYGYTFRVSQDGGVSWTYCDGNGAGTGANDFEITRVPTLNSN